MRHDMYRYGVQLSLIWFWARDRTNRLPDDTKVRLRRVRGSYLGARWLLDNEVGVPLVDGLGVTLRSMVSDDEG